MPEDDPQGDAHGATLAGHAPTTAAAVPAGARPAAPSPFQRTITAPPIASAATVASDSLPAVAAATSKGRSSVGRSTVGNELRGASIERFTPVEASRFEVLDELARGGLGRVFRARDPRTGRIVAIKEVLHPQPEIMARFAREALVTANLQHPAIVPVYEVGRWPSGEPFYAMKLVEGRTLDALIGEATTLAARVALLPHVIAVAEALAYAHGERVIHRDLKPANILVGAYGETVVIDWGLAKNLASGEEIEALPVASTLPPDATETVAGSVLGTPAYMPPEQALGEKLDERADVYAIGAILYHALSGRRPFAQAKALDELIELVAYGTPAPLAELAPDLPPELVAIVAHAMARDPAQRYATAQGIAHDLRAFQAGKLVGAHRYTPWQLVRRWVAQHTATVATAAIALATLIVVAAIGVWRITDERDEADHQRAIAQRERSDAQDARLLAEQRFADSLEELARQALVAGDPARALPLAAGALANRRDVPAGLAVIAAQTRAPYAALVEVVPSPRYGVTAASLNTIGDRFYTASAGDEVVRAVDAATGRELWRAHAGYMAGLSRDDRRLVTATAAGEVLVLAADTGSVLGRWPLFARAADAALDPVSFLRWSPDSVHLAIATKSGKLFALATDGGIPMPLAGHRTEINKLEISPDGAYIASSANDDDTVLLHDAATGAVRARIAITRGGAWGLSWLDADHLAIGDPRYARIYNPRTQATEATYDHGTWVYGAVLGGPPDARWLVTYGDGPTARLWNAATHAKIADLPGHNVAVLTAMAVGDWLVTLDEFGNGFVWDPRTGERVQTIPRASTVYDAEARGDRLFAFGELRQEVWQLPPAGGALAGLRRLAVHSARIRDLAFEGDSAVWTASNDGTLRRTPLDGSAPRVIGTAGYAEQLRTFADPDAQKPPYAHGMRSFVVGRDGRSVLAANEDGSLVLYDTATAQPRVTFAGHTGRVRKAVITPDGATVYSVGDTTVRRWDAATGRQTAIGQLVDLGWDIALFPDGTVATLDDKPGHALALWTPALARKPLAFDPVIARELQLVGDKLIAGTYAQLYLVDANGAVTANAPHPKAFALATGAGPHGPRGFVAGDSTGDIVLHAAATGEALRAWTAGDGMVNALAFSPDGELVASASGSRVRIWDPRTGSLLVATAELPSIITQLAWSSDGTRLAFAGSTGTLWIWDIRPPRALGDLAAFARCASLYQLSAATLERTPPDRASCRVLAPSR